MTKFFSKKLLVYFVLIMFSISNLSAKRVNVDLKPIEDLLNRYYNICQASWKPGQYTANDKKAKEALKSLFRHHEYLENKLGQCHSDLDIGHENKLDTIKIKVRMVITTQYQGAYKARYSIFADGKVDREIGVFPVKNANGKIEWKL